MAPPKPISVKSFVAASQKYVKDQVEKANVNQNAYLTKTEAKALPQDLQDNFEKFRSSNWNKVAHAEGFVAHHSRQVSSEAARADVNGDGLLDLNELRLLPKELQDNAANFGKVTLPQGPGPINEVQLPLAPEALEQLRGAMVDYVETNLTVRTPSEWEPGEFEYKNHTWGQLVRESGGDKSHAGLKREMLQMAKTFDPSSPKWEVAHSDSERSEVVAHFQMITFEVNMVKGKAPIFFSEIC